MSIRYTVTVDAYADKYYIKTFEKKYKNRWDVTLRAIILELENVDELSDTNFFEKINILRDGYIAKGEFKIAATLESKKTSGCRYIVRVDTVKCIVDILLVYHKNEVSINNETVWWQNKIKNL